MSLRRCQRINRAGGKLNPNPSRSVCSLTEWRAAKRDPVAPLGRADARAETATPDRGSPALLAAVLEGEAVEPRKGDRLRHGLVQDWLTLLLTGAEVADLTLDDRRNGPWDRPPGCTLPIAPPHTNAPVRSASWDSWRPG